MNNLPLELVKNIGKFNPHVLVELSQCTNDESIISHFKNFIEHENENDSVQKFHLENLVSCPWFTIHTYVYNQLAAKYKYYSNFLESKPEMRNYNVIPDRPLLNINMMPINLFNLDSIPEFCKDYLYLILNCQNHISNEYFQTIDSETWKPIYKNPVAYLTIHESFVKKGETQRRPGIHTESPKLKLNDIDNQCHNEYLTLAWGRGYHGGIFTWSNVSNSTRFWNCQIKEDGILEGGDCEYLRKSLNDFPVISNESNSLYFMTDRTPHEALPASSDCFRVFFRLVVGKVDVWFKKHSTKNPLGILPGVDTKILDINKFE